MKVFFIAKGDTATGLSLAGIEGITVDEQTDAEKLFNEAIDSDIGLLLISESVANLIRKRLDTYKVSVKIPIVLEIPEENGTTRDKNYLTKYVNQSVGSKS